MKVTEAMIKEKTDKLVKNLNDISGISKSLIVIYGKSAVGMVNKIIKIIGINIDFIKTIDKKDKYIFIEEMISFTNDVYLLFTNYLAVIDNGDRKLLMKTVGNDMDRLNKLRRKIEKKYEDDDDDDEFFDIAAWLL